MSIVRLPYVKAELGFRSHTSVYNGIRAGLITTSISTGERSVGWPDYEVHAIRDARIAGHTDDQIRSLVQRLLAKRTELLPKEVL